MNTGEFPFIVTFNFLFGKIQFIFPQKLVLEIYITAQRRRCMVMFKIVLLIQIFELFKLSWKNQNPKMLPLFGKTPYLVTIVLLVIG